MNNLVTDILKKRKELLTGVRAQQGILNYNLNLYRQGIAQIFQDTFKKAEEVRDEASNIASGFKADFASSGIISTSGSALLAQQEQKAQGQKAAQDILSKGGLIVEDYKRQINNTSSQFNNLANTATALKKQIKVGQDILKPKKDLISL